MMQDAPYVPPFGTPLYWGNEQSGVLRAAVMAFYATSLGKGTCSESELRLVIDYAQYVIGAPCWQGPEIEALRESAKHLRSVTDINRWIGECLSEGIDPL